MALQGKLQQQRALTGRADGAPIATRLGSRSSCMSGAACGVHGLAPSAGRMGPGAAPMPASQRAGRAASVLVRAAASDKPWKTRDARLVLEDGSVWTGFAFGAKGTEIGEVVFNTSLTGYEEIMTDPSYKGQFVAFTCPHIGNVGINYGERAMPVAARQLHSLLPIDAIVPCMASLLHA